MPLTSFTRKNRFQERSLRHPWLTRKDNDDNQYNNNQYNNNQYNNKQDGARQGPLSSYSAQTSTTTTTTTTTTKENSLPDMTVTEMVVTASKDAVSLMRDGVFSILGNATRQQERQQQERRGCHGLQRGSRRHDALSSVGTESSAPWVGTLIVIPRVDSNVSDFDASRGSISSKEEEEEDDDDEESVAQETTAAILGPIELDRSSTTRTSNSSSSSRCSSNARQQEQETRTDGFSLPFPQPRSDGFSLPFVQDNIDNEEEIVFEHHGNGHDDPDNDVDDDDDYANVILRLVHAASRELEKHGPPPTTTQRQPKPILRTSRLRTLYASSTRIDYNAMEKSFEVTVHSDEASSSSSSFRDKNDKDASQKHNESLEQTEESLEWSELAESEWEKALDIMPFSMLFCNAFYFSTCY